MMATRKTATEAIVAASATVAPMKFMKRPNYVQAMLVTKENAVEVAAWIEGRAVTDAVMGDYVVIPHAPAAQNRAKVGEYVVLYPNGNAARASADAFEETYIPA